MIKRLSEVKMQLDERREKGVVRGNSVGWDWNRFPYTVKLGTTTFIAAAPASGKTEWWLEILINLSCLYGWNHVLYTPETGDAVDIFSELCHKFVGKPFIKGENSMTEIERTKAEYFVDSHFYVIDPIDEEVTIESFFAMVDEVEKKYETTIQTTTIDPWNELTERYEKEDLGREDKYLSRILGLVRKNARKTNRHNCVLNHVRDQAAVTKDGITYYPAPSARDFAGGQVWFRKGLSVLIPWRPPVGLQGSDGRPYEENELHLRIAKAKPKGTSKVGVYRFFLDVTRYQYYVKDEMTDAMIYANRGAGNVVKTDPTNVVQIQLNNFNGFKQSDFDETDSFIVDQTKGNYKPDPHCGF